MNIILQSSPASELRYIVAETVISTAINMVLAGGATYLMLGRTQIVLWGFGGLAVDLIPATFLPILAMTAGLTWVTRRRRRAGTVASIAARPLPLPANPWWRGFLFGALATGAFGSLGLAVLSAIWSPELPFTAILAFKIGYSACIAVAATPLILHAALRDPVPAAARSAPL